MSKPYRIQVQDVISVQDSSTFFIDPVPLLSPQSYTEIFSQVLEEDGWVAGEDGRMTQTIDGEMSYEFDPETMQIRTIIDQKEEVSQSLEGWSQDDLKTREQALLERRERSLTQRAIQKLEESSEKRRAECEELVVEATGRAIKEAAKQLGDVQDVHEERGADGRYQLTITIEDNS